MSWTFGDLERSDQGHLLKNRVSVLVIDRGSNGIISSTFGDLEKSDQGHRMKNRVPLRDSAIVTI